MGRRENPHMQGFLHAARHLAIIALLLRAMLPAGWMPDARAGLVICSLGTVSIGTLGTIHHDGDQKAPAQAVHEECAFAAAAPLAAAPDTPLLTLPALHAFAADID